MPRNDTGACSGMFLAVLAKHVRAWRRKRDAAGASDGRHQRDGGKASGPNGKEGVAARLFDEYGNSIYRLAYSYVRSSQDAEDVLQDTLVQFLRKEPRFNDAQHEKAWLLRVAANLAKNRLKSPRAGRIDELADRLTSDDDPDLAFVWDAVGSLPEQQCEVIHLFYQEGYSTREIARILERNESTVRSDLTRGRNALRDVLKGAYDFD